MDLNGKRILITGASSGLGRELAYQIFSKGKCRSNSSGKKKRSTW